MENTRAFYLLEKTELSKEDRKFLKKHIETYEEMLRSSKIENKLLKDTIDYGKFLNNEIMQVKESLLVMFKDREITERINRIFNFIENK
jgi:vacuolar-type H+-ATPase subunit B/Vma2